MKSIRTLFTVLILLLAMAPIKAQELERQVVATAGGTDQNTAISLEWTMGELMVESFSGNQFLITQGFHQPRLSIVGIAEQRDQLRLALTIYPNPSQDVVHIRIDDQQNLRTVLLYDVPGNVLVHQTFNGEVRSASIPMDRFADGTYLLKLEFDNGRPFSIHKIIKN